MALDDGLVLVYLEHTEKRIWAHPPEKCEGEACSLHARSEHSMRAFPQHWRGDRALMERICPHGVGHPDPDHIAHVRRTRGDAVADAEAVHGCDGCCAP